ncbi:chromosomal replication initiator DnaA [Pseudoprimorskyibacter insulae]|uniref:DnaA regulatory inactivator Hda n=1 Tax=Pseudoprimorskyibacter insulae TaxID=1695997 RepID=A0A2R8ARD6_9RHOB|nr:chromosomal replication initiator DnaA [Pseudoprimorskyibacter insulae]SPF78447.1 DnaA regulatory inactivator Hda [Pseudoprimorskyibacter insulae]
MSTEQFALPLEFKRLNALGRGDFFISDSNALAVAMIDCWNGWAGRKLALVGPAGSGKTHLAHVWASLSGATIITASELAEADIPALAQGCVCVEDIEGLFGDAKAENALFHLHNLTLAEGNSLLVTARTAPTQWVIALPDLASRMQGTQVTQLGDPDDKLLAAVLAKLLFDRQITPGVGLIPYLVPRMPRAFAAAQTLVDALDRAALAQRKDITRDLARTVLVDLGWD